MLAQRYRIFFTSNSLSIKYHHRTGTAVSPESAGLDQDVLSLVSLTNLPTRHIGVYTFALIPVGKSSCSVPEDTTCGLIGHVPNTWMTKWRKSSIRDGDGNQIPTLFVILEGCRLTPSLWHLTSGTWLWGSVKKFSMFLLKASGRWGSFASYKA